MDIQWRYTLLNRLKSNNACKRDTAQYVTFLKTEVHFQDRWGPFKSYSEQHWRETVRFYNLDYMCHPYFKRNITARFYDKYGKQWTVEDIITNYHAGTRSVKRLWQQRDRLTKSVIGFEWITYDIKDPTIWRDRCIQHRMNNYDIHEIRDWRYRGCPVWSEWQRIRTQNGKWSHNAHKVGWDSNRKELYEGTRYNRSNDEMNYNTPNNTLAPYGDISHISGYQYVNNNNSQERYAMHYGQPLFRNQYNINQNNMNQNNMNQQPRRFGGWNNNNPNQYDSRRSNNNNNLGQYDSRNRTDTRDNRNKYESANRTNKR